MTEQEIQTLAKEFVHKQYQIGRIDMSDERTEERMGVIAQMTLAEYGIFLMAYHNAVADLNMTMMDEDLI